jgi:hypothetical protein
MLSFLAALSLVVAASMRTFSICREVNQRLAKYAQIDAWDRAKFFDILRLHGEMYPESPKRWQMWTLFLFGAALGFAAFFALILPKS